MKDQNNQNNQINQMNQEIDSNFNDLQDQMQRNIEEEKNEDGIRNVMNNIASNENASTENETETRNEPKEDQKIYKTKPLPDVNFENSKNFLEKIKFAEQKKSQENYNAILVDIIKVDENRRLSVYQDQIEFNLYVYEVTIGDEADEKANWFFPNRFDAYNFVYNFYRRKFALNQLGRYKRVLLLFLYTKFYKCYLLHIIFDYKLINII